MECKCGAVAHRSVEEFTNQRTAEEASGQEIKRLPCRVVKDKCPACTRSSVMVWYTQDSKPVSKGILGLFQK